MPIETKIAEPIMIKRNRMNCWKVFLRPLACVPYPEQVIAYNVDKLTVLRPERNQPEDLASQGAS
jgi:hypothetical protein